MKHIAELATQGFIVDIYHQHWIRDMVKERDGVILSLAGNKAILSGVEADGGNTTDGVVTFNGKIYRFIGGVTGANVVTKKITIDRPNNQQIPQPAYYEDVIEFGDNPDAGFDTFPFADLTRYYVNPPRLKEIKIIGRNITNAELAGTGWFLADGQNGTDNLIDKFFVTAGGDHAVASTVGSKTKTISAGNLPNASTNVFVGQQGNGYPDGAVESIAQGDNQSYPRKTKQLTLGDFGANNEPLDVTPLSFAVVAIQFIGL